MMGEEGLLGLPAKHASTRGPRRIQFQRRTTHQLPSSCSSNSSDWYRLSLASGKLLTGRMHRVKTS
jgi:hypothetical protein